MNEKKYDPIPEDGPRYRKKKVKRHVKSDHKHEYEDVVVNANSYVCAGGERRPLYYIANRCRVCGKVGNVVTAYKLAEPPNSLSYYEVGSIFELMKSMYLEAVE